MNPIYIIKRINTCEIPCDCCITKTICPENLAATQDERKSIEIRDFYIAKCAKDCVDKCFTYTIEKLFITGQYEDLC